MFRKLIFIYALLPAVLTAAPKKEDVKARMKADVTYLASDQLEGRLTGSSGEYRSSLYIADEFRKYKLQPKGNDSGSYFQTFNIIKVRISQSSAPMIWTERGGLIRGLKPVDGAFYPVSFSCNNDSLENVPVHIAGYGIQAPELNHNDYSDTNGIRGKVFVIRLGSPESGNAHGKFAPFESLNYKVDQAIRYGARAVLLIATDSGAEVPTGKLDRNIRPRSIPVMMVRQFESSLLLAGAISFRVKIAQLNATAHNVIGYVNNKKAKTIVIGAHQDHLGYNEYGGSRDPQSGQIHNGADDNASGVAMMLELMRSISKNKKLRKHNYLFVAFSGEEQGLLGSNWLVKHPVIDMKNVECMLNFDMVGRLDSIKKVLMVYGVGTSPVWKEQLQKVHTDSSNIRIKTTESGTGSSDHTSFYFENIPVLHFFTGQHYDYHKPSDDEHLINYEGMYQCYDVVMQLMKGLNKVQSMPFTATKSEESEKMSFKVTLGIMPDYIYDGNGLRVDGVNPGKPGEKAGLKKGDIILKLGDHTIGNIQDYMKALGSFKKGDTTTVKILREGKETELTVTF